VSADVVEETAAMMRDFHPAGMRAMARAFAEADLRDVLPSIDVPTLLLYGDADQRSPRDVAEALHAAIPGSRLVWIHGVGHQSNLEAPGRFNDAARTFLRSL
jgi:pimeloyl-ACP methyl ester carboxylesterase